MPWKSPRFTRNTVVFTTLSTPLPASSRIAARLRNTCSVCSWIVSPTISVCPGSSASWPETNTRSPARIACEYGAPWNGAGAFSVRTTVFSAIGYSVLSRGAARLGEGDPKRLEDRLQDVLRIVAVDEANVQGQTGTHGEFVQETRNEVGAEAADVLCGEVDVRDDERPAGGLERDVCERLVRGNRRASVAADPLGPQQTRERLPEGAPGRGELRLRRSGSNLERQIERRVCRQELEQPVHDR